MSPPLPYSINIHILCTYCVLITFLGSGAVNKTDKVPDPVDLTVQWFLLRGHQPQPHQGSYSSWTTHAVRRTSSVFTGWSERQPWAFKSSLSFFPFDNFRCLKPAVLCPLSFLQLSISFVFKYSSKNLAFILSSHPLNWYPGSLFLEYLTSAAMGKPPSMIFSKSRRFWDVIVIDLKLILVSLRVAVCPAKKHFPASLAARNDHVIQFWPIRYKHKIAVGLWRKLTKSQVNSAGQPTPFALFLLFTCQKLSWAAKSWAAKHLCKVVKMKLTVSDWIIYCDSISKRLLNRRKCWLMFRFSPWHSARQESDGLVQIIRIVSLLKDP